MLTSLCCCVVVVVVDVVVKCVVVVIVDDDVVVGHVLVLVVGRQVKWRASWLVRMCSWCGTWSWCVMGRHFGCPLARWRSVCVW